MLDPTTRTLTYSRAGHNPPRLLRAGQIISIEDSGAIPLGIIDEQPYAESTMTLEKEDLLLLYTDGITEAFSPSQEQFSVERLDNALTGCSGQPDCIVDSIHKALFAHRQAATRDDDQTIVAIRHHGICRI